MEAVNFQADIANLNSRSNIYRTLEHIIDCISEMDALYTNDQNAKLIISLIIAILQQNTCTLPECMSCTRCIRSYVQILPSTIRLFYDPTKLQLIVNCFYTKNCPEIREDCVTIIYQISSIMPNILTRTDFIEKLPAAVVFLGNQQERIMKRSLLDIFDILLTRLNFKASFVPVLFNFTNYLRTCRDRDIKERLISIICLIGRDNILSLDVLKELAKSFTTNLTENELVNYCDLFIKQLELNNYRACAACEINFKPLLMNMTSASYNEDLHEKYGRIIREILTPGYYNNGILIKDSEEQKAFAMNIQPILMECLESGPLSPLRILQAFASSLLYNKPKATPHFVGSLFYYAHDIKYCGAICYICHCYVGDPLIIGSNVYFEGQKKYDSETTPYGSMKISDQTRYFFGTKREEMNRRVVPNSIHEILSLLDSSERNIAELMYQGMMKTCLLRIRIEEGVDYAKLENYLTQCLQFVSFIRRDGVSMIPFDFSSFLNTEMDCIIKFGNTTAHASFKPCDSVALMIGTIVRSCNPRLFQQGRNLRYDEKWKYLRYDCVDDIPVGAFYQLINIYSASPSDLVLVTSDGKEFGSECSMLDLLIHEAKDENQMKSTTTLFLTLRERMHIDNFIFIGSSDDDEDDDVMECGSSTPEVCPLNEKEKDLFDLLKICNEKCKVKESREFNNILRKEFKNIVGSVTRLTDALYIIKNCPFLINWKLKMLAFHLQIYQAGNRFREIISYLKGDLSKYPQFLPDSQLKLTLPRTGIFDIVKKYLVPALASPHPIEIHFENEVGTGRGPTKEFFTLIMQEIVSTGKGIFRHTKNGYFPCPNINPDDFYIIGVIIGKVILMDCITQVLISPCFFTLLTGDMPSPEQVDPELCELLKHRENFIMGEGMEVPYEFPGCENFLKGGVITEENFDNYVRDVSSNIINDKIVQAAVEFKKGLQKVISYEKALSIFTPTEISSIVYGEDSLKITVESLKNCTIVDLGYTVNSPQVQWVFEYITTADVSKRKKFIHFVTANDYLPFGGFEALNPPFSIFKMETPAPDNYFPQASTCSSLLKLPEYSSKEIFVQRLEEALKCGNGKFELE